MPFYSPMIIILTILTMLDELCLEIWSAYLRQRRVHYGWGGTSLAWPLGTAWICRLTAVLCASPPLPHNTGLRIPIAARSLDSSLLQYTYQKRYLYKRRYSLVRRRGRGRTPLRDSHGCPIHGCGASSGGWFASSDHDGNRRHSSCSRVSPCDDRAAAFRRLGSFFGIA